MTVLDGSVGSQCVGFKVADRCNTLWVKVATRNLILPKDLWHSCWSQFGSFQKTLGGRKRPFLAMPSVIRGDIVMAAIAIALKLTYLLLTLAWKNSIVWEAVDIWLGSVPTMPGNMPWFYQYRSALYMISNTLQKFPMILLFCFCLSGKFSSAQLAEVTSQCHLTEWRTASYAFVVILCQLIRLPFPFYFESIIGKWKIALFLNPWISKSSLSLKPNFISQINQQCLLHSW